MERSPEFVAEIRKNDRLEPADLLGFGFGSEQRFLGLFALSDICQEGDDDRLVRAQGRSRKSDRDRYRVTGFVNEGQFEIIAKPLAALEFLPFFSNFWKILFCDKFCDRMTGDLIRGPAADCQGGVVNV